MDSYFYPPTFKQHDFPDYVYFDATDQDEGARIGDKFLRSFCCLGSIPQKGDGDIGISELTP